jgi:hypothetical protein
MQFASGWNGQPARSGGLPARLLPQFIHPIVSARSKRSEPPAAKYLFNAAVGMARCAVRAAFSGAIPSFPNVSCRRVPPAAARAATSQRNVPTLAKHGRGKLPPG